MKTIKQFCFLLLVMWSSISCNAKNDKEATKPNLLFIFPDQFRVQAMGFMNEDPVQTPGIDRFAKEAVVFNNAVSNRPLCTPFRGMLMTGKYCFSNHLQTNCNTSSRKYGNFLREDETCFSDVLNKNGYMCGYIGKWHLDAPSYDEGPDVDDWRKAVWESYTAPGAKRHGFKFWHAYGCNNRHNNPYYWENDAPVEDTLFAGKWSPIHEADIAIDFMESNKSKPWALFVSMNPPHGPYSQVPQRYKDIYADIPLDSLLNRPNVPDGKKGNVGRKNVRDYFACVTGIDEQFGRIVDALEKTGQKENTIVIFAADHGEMMGGHGLLQKVVWYEESLRIPFVMRWPAKLKAGINDLHLSVPDIMPSLLALMGMEKEIPKTVEGENYADVMLGKSTEKPEFSLYLNCLYPTPKGGKRGIRTSRYTFVVEKDNDGNTTNYRLYDNKNDHFQLKNIADENPDLVDKFEHKMMKQLQKINDPWTKEK